MVFIKMFLKFSAFAPTKVLVIEMSKELHVGFHIFLCLSFNPKWKEEKFEPT
jgi:hypothetical protein